MKNIKYLWLVAIVLGFTACNDEEDYEEFLEEPPVDAVVLPALTAGSADFSNYVALGASFTAGYADGALFIAGQENSFPNLLSKQFANANGGAFNQPLMNDNIGGLVAAGNIVINPATNENAFKPRFYLDLTGNSPKPVRLDEASTTDFILNNPTGTFNNVGVPGAKSTHINFNGYAGLNPYFGRFATSPTISMLEYAIERTPTFFTLSEIGGNDVLGYATSGGESDTSSLDYDPITPTATFDFVFNDMVDQLTAVSPNGAVGNIPYITDLPHFTTIVYNQLDPNDEDIGPLLIPQIPALNAQLYGPLDNIFTAYGEPDRVNILSTTEANPLLINDENATDRSAEITGALTPVLGAATATLFGQLFGKARQATANDLIVLLASSEIAQPVPGIPAPVNINGISFPMADKWVLLPSEQLEIRTAIDAYNATIFSVTTAKGLAFVDFNAVLGEASSTGILFDDYNLTTGLVSGGLASLDGIHLTARGYALMTNKFLEAIDTTYGSNFVASGNVTKAEDFGVIYSPNLQ